MQSGHHEHDHLGHRQHGARRPRTLTAQPSLLRLSAPARLAIAGVIVAAVWSAVFWAVR